ncbi:MAG: type III-A CRISPR-associated RAMP protein Csm3 [Balneolaceae bacterium]|nr:type III-A CRISPR-associated RAMP protein Csm3 [Balneolaceae bacterium]
MKALKKKVLFTIPLKLKSGLHVGGSNMSMAIGGADSVVIRDPLTQQPIIPGSSIKGKMRSLSEKLLGAYQEVNMGVVKFGPYQDTDDEIKRIIPELYGKAAGGDDNIPSRVIVRDAHLTDESEKELRNSENMDMLYSEVKTEVVIDRVTSAAMPRQIERVPAGSEFEVSLLLNVFEDDDEKKLVDYVKVGLRLMEDDYLGGSGSRGSGEVALDWEGLSVTQKTLSDYEKGNDWQSHQTG